MNIFTNEEKTEVEVLLEIREKIKVDIEIQKLFNKIADKISVVELRKLLKDLSVLIGYDLNEAYIYFKKPINPDDTSDVFNPYSFDFSQFVHRMQNFICYKIYLLQGYEGGLANYISSLNEHLSESNQIKTPVPKKVKKAKKIKIASVDLDFPQIAQASNNLTQNLLRKYSHEIQCIFHIYAIDGFIDVRKTINVLIEIVNINIVTLFSHELEFFQRLVYICYPARKIPDYYLKLLEADHIEELKKLEINYEVFYPKISIFEFVKVLDAFFDISPPLDEFQKSLLRDIRNYKKIYKKNRNSLVNEILISLKSAYSHHITRKNYFNISAEETQLMKKVFVLYDKPLHLNYFLKFLQDFEVIGNPLTQYRFITKKQGKSIYTHICLNSMSLTQFLVTLI